MTKRVGLLGLMAAAAVTLITPAVASAQDRYDHPRYYGRAPIVSGFGFGVQGSGYGVSGFGYGPAPTIYRDQYWRERDWREARERQIIREREWRERQRCERERAPYYGYR